MTDDADDLSLERAAFDVTRDGFDLFRAACLLGRVEGRAVDVQGCVETIERWTAGVRGSPGNPDHAWARLLQLLSGDLHLTGDAALVDDPQADFIDRVLETRRGSPLALSVVTQAVAEAIGMAAFVVVLPDHVVTGIGRRDSFFLLDTHAGCRVLSQQDVLARAGVATVEGLAEAINASTPERVLMRLLANLHRSYLRRSERGPLVRVLARMLIFDPRNVGLWLQRAQLRLEDADFAGAVADLTRAQQLPLDDDWQRVADDLARRIDAVTSTVQ